LKPAKEGGDIDYGKLQTALSKYWKPLSKREFWHEMDLEDTREACGFIPEEIWSEYVQPKKRQAFTTLSPL
jgi:hypothetical protein